MLPRESNGRTRGIWIVTENVTKDFVENFGLNGLLDKMLGALLQSGKNVFLVADGGDHDDARVGMLAHDAVDGFDAFHLGHGDVHEDDVGLTAIAEFNRIKPDIVLMDITMRSTASMPSIWGMVMSMRTMSGLMRLNSAMAVRPSPASPATTPPKISIIFMMFLRAKTESSTTR